MKRILTASVLVPLFLYLVAFAPHWLFLPALALVASFCYFEFLGIAAASFPQYPNQQRNPFGYVAGLLLLTLPNQEGLLLVVAAILLMILLLRTRDLAGFLPLAAVTIFGIVYAYGTWRCGNLLRLMSPWWLLYAVSINWIGDTFAFYGGRAFGKRKLAPRVSPGKSWEGTIASLVLGGAAAVAYLHFLIPSVPLPQAIALSLVANIAGQMGDLCESAMKRGAGVKDSGTLLPGHGGWLDRVDSSLFSVPVVYWLINQPWFLP
jgi:phosphatidate cytidylyltransferase